MMLLIGPCMFLAPVVVLLVPIGIVLWPPTLLLVGLAWLVLWPAAAIARARHAGRPARMTRVHATLGRWFRTLCTPWNYFDVPDRKPPPAQ